MTTNLSAHLRIDESQLQRINDLLTGDNRAMHALMDVIARYGTPEEINRKAEEAGRLSTLMRRLEEIGSPYLPGLHWLIEQRDGGAFIPLSEYRRKVLGERAGEITVDQSHAVTLEISALQFFPWLIAEAEQAIQQGELMPGRFIRVRNMKEQDDAGEGEIMAVAAAMQIIGASYVETLDTKGTDGSNVHLGGPETITGYFGGVGQPNEYALKWVDEYLSYYTRYGVRQVLNVNAGTIFLGFMLYKLGIDIAFKISVFTGHDNPYFALWTLLAAHLFARPDGSTALVGLNWSNSVNNDTIAITAEIRRLLGFEDCVRFEHHITETFKSIVRQPYLRRDELVEIAAQVPNISAKHEGGEPDVEAMREHPSDLLEYFLSREEIEQRGLMPALLRNYLDKHEALNRTAEALLSHGIGVIPARYLHGLEKAPA